MVSPDARRDARIIGEEITIFLGSREKGTEASISATDSSCRCGATGIQTWLAVKMNGGKIHRLHLTC